MFKREFVVIYNEVIGNCEPEISSLSFDTNLASLFTWLGCWGDFILCAGPCLYRKEQFLKQREVKIDLYLHYPCNYTFALLPDCEDVKFCSRCEIWHGTSGMLGQWCFRQQYELLKSRARMWRMKKLQTCGLKQRFHIPLEFLWKLFLVRNVVFLINSRVCNLYSSMWEPAPLHQWLIDWSGFQ